VIINKQFSNNSPVFMDNLVHKNVVKDGKKVGLFNSNESSSLDYYSLELGGLESSSWISYEPGNVRYRFLGFQIFMSADVVETERMTYGLAQMLGETGGLFIVLDLVFTFFFGLVAPIRLYSYLAAALYRDNTEEQAMIDILVTPRDGGSARDVDYTAKEEFAFVVPTLVDLKSILLRFCCCCLQKDFLNIKVKEYRTFMDKTKDVKGEIDKNLDIVKYV
jgi:hypothetical protein